MNGYDTVLAVAVALAFSAPAPAVDFVVTSTADTVDANPGDGQCADAGGACSLRAAVMEANAFAGPDTIHLPDGTYALSIFGPAEDAALTGDLDVLDDLTISGASRAGTIIDGSLLDRIIDVLGNDEVRLEHLSIVNGSSEEGGGILNRGALTLHDVTMEDCRTPGEGGAISSSQAALVLENSELVGNESVDYGGAIHASGLVVIDGSVIRDNLSQTRAGGIYLVSGVLTVRHGSLITLNRSLGSAGGVDGETGSITISDSTLSYNEADGYGGAMYSDYATVEVDGCTFTSNSCTSQGGVLYAYGGAFASFQDCAFTGNFALARGGVYAGEIVSASFEWCTFEANSTEGVGGALYGNGEPLLTADWCVFDGNEAVEGGGAVCIDAGAFEARDCDFFDSASGDGGAITLTPGTCLLERCLFVGNSTTTEGGVVYLADHGLVARDCLFQGNTAGEDGGAIRGEAGFLSLEGCDFIDNDCVGFGGAIYSDCAGQAVDCRFEDNDAADGGAVVIDGEASSFTDCEFVHNTAGLGGAMYASCDGTSLVRCRFIGNHTIADGHDEGGAIYSGGYPLSGAQCLFEGNTARTGGAVSSDSGGYADFVATTFMFNTAGDEGGAVYNRTPFSAVNCTMSGNVAFRGGAFWNNETATFLNCTIANNTAALTALDPPSGAQLTGALGKSLTAIGPSANGGGFFNDGGMIVFANTILADNGDENCTGPDGVLSLGHNIDTDGSCELDGPGDLSGVAALLGPLQDNGGFAPTHALLAGSPAVDSADDGLAPVVDQRGVPRPDDGDGDGEAHADRGAYEADGSEGGGGGGGDFGCCADEAIDAPAICPGPPQAGNNIGATGAPLFCGLQFGAHDVWVRYDPATTGLAAVNVQGPPLTWLIEVWNGLPGVDGAVIACGQSPVSVTFLAQVGRCYYVRIAAVGFGEGDFQVQLSGPPCE